MAAGITLIRSRSGGASSVNPYTVTCDGSASAGADVFAVSEASGVGTFTSFSDSVNGNWTSDVQTSDAGSVGRAFLARKLAIGGGIVNASTTLSLMTGASSFKGIGAWMMTGGTVGAFDQSNVKKTGTGTAITSNATGTLAQANEIAFAVFFFAGTPTFTEQVGWTNVFGAGNYIATTSTVINVACCFIQTAATTALSPTATLGTSNVWGSICGTYTWTDSGPAGLAPAPRVYSAAVRTGATW